MESRGIASCVGSAEGREGLNAFVEKRKPNFK
ncbi:MAG: 1,4-dihydroxy-2-naphthoyl-CoA synthase [Zhongshania sp.]